MHGHERVVWLVNHHAQEPGGFGPTRHFDLARNLARHGWRACIVAASVEHGTGRQRLPRAERWRHEQIEGVDFLWLRTPPYAGNGPARVANMLAFTARVLGGRWCRELPAPDVVIGSTVHPLAAWAAAVVAARLEVPFVFEIRDLWPQTLIEMGRIRPGGPTARVMRALERHLVRRAARVLTLLPGSVPYLEGLGIAPERICWLPNGVDLASTPVLPAPSGEPGLELLYLGAHGEANSLQTLIDAMAVVERDPAGDAVRCRLVGDGNLKAALVARAAASGLARTVFEPAVPKAAVRASAASADAFVLCTRDLPGLYRHGVSMNKLFEYLAFGRPVIVALEAANNPVADARAGLTVAPEDAVALARAILEVAALAPAERETLGRNGREYVARHHDYRALAARLSSLLDEVAARAAPGP